MARLVTRDFLEASFTGFRALFERGFQGADPLYAKLSTVVDSSNSKESWNWLGAVPAMREWTDERVPGALRTNDYEIANRRFEASIEVDRETFEDDRLAQLKPRIEELALRAASHPDELVVGLLANGFTDTGYDGKAFFADDHKQGDSGTQVNKMADKLGSTSLKLAIETMMAFRDDHGKPFGLLPDTLLVGPDNYFTARELLNSTGIVLSGGTDLEKPDGNGLSGMLNLQVSPWVPANHWFVLATQYPVRPLLFQWRVRPEFSAVTRPDDEYVFSADAYKFGVRSRCGAGYGLWQMAVGSDGSA
ncbi:Mu-like prophage major head subunit gpT family protein [bacterium]|nr:Mu-like prophage major head subunit gpT family protein [bacterium]